MLGHLTSRDGNLFQPELQKTAESYRTRIGELQGLEEDLRKMLAEAKRVNQVSKEQLAVVKPYRNPLSIVTSNLGNL